MNIIRRIAFTPAAELIYYPYEIVSPVTKDSVMAWDMNYYDSIFHISAHIEDSRVKPKAWTIYLIKKKLAEFDHHRNLNITSITRMSFIFFAIYFYIILFFIYIFNLKISFIYFNCQYLWTLFKFNKLNLNNAWIYNKKDADILDDMIIAAEKADLSNSMEDLIPLRGSINSNITSHDFFKLKEHNMLLIYVKSIMRKKEEFLDSLLFYYNIFSSNITYKKKKVTLKHLKQNLYELQFYNRNLKKIFNSLDLDKKIIFKKILDDILNFDINPLYRFDYKQYVFNPQYSNFFELHIDERSKFLLFLRYGCKRISY